MTSPATDGGTSAEGAVTGDQGVQPAGGAPQDGQGAPDAGTQHGMYDKYLAAIPKGLHGTVTEAFKTWDADVTKRSQEQQSRYAPYQSLIDSGSDPQQLQAAQEFMAWMQEDPKAALALAAETFGVDFAGNPTDGQGEPDQAQTAGEGTPAGGEIPPWFAEHQKSFQAQQQLVETMAQALVQQHQGQQMEQTVGELETHLRSAATAAQVDLDNPQAQDYILSRMAMTPDSVPPEKAAADAVKAWTDLTGAIRGSAASAGVPPVMGAGGGMPTQQVDPATLSTADRRKQVAENARRMMLGG